jgi:uncharacterized protein (TIGR00369 family)
VPALTNSQRAQILKVMGEYIPHTHLLGICVEHIDGEELTMRLPYQQELVGDPDTGTLHGGALTVLLDQTLGMSAICSDGLKPSVTPTLDLRIDHLGVAPARMDVLATARVYKVTRKIIFVEGIAYCESRDKPVARATGSWVRLGEVDLTPFLGLKKKSQA